MRAALLMKPYELVVKEVDEPKLGPGDILVRIECAAIDGTDIGIYNGKQKVKYPLIGGHEATGHVEEVGSEVSGFAVGQKVVINPLRSCMECEFCQIGRVNLCRRGGLMGREDAGLYAQYASVPAHRVYGFKPELSCEEGTLFITLATVVYSQRRLPSLLGSSVVVLGQGVSGLLHTQIAKLSGASPLIAVSRSPWKLELARKFKADLTLNSSIGDPVRSLMDATMGEGADVVIESAGSVETIRLSLEMARPGGTVLQYGIGPSAVDGLNVQLLYTKEIVIVGSRSMLGEDFRKAIKLVEAGSVELSPLITHRYPMERIKEAFDLLDQRPGDALRVIVNIRSLQNSSC